MTIFTMHTLIFHKLRRSVRLMEKNALLIEKESAPTGVFRTLPLEVVHRIFYFTPLVNLGQLALTSKQMRNLIEDFVKSKRGLKGFFPICIHKINSSQEEKEKLKAHFHELGIMMKRLTCLYPTKERLRKIDDFISSLKCQEIDCKCLKMTVSFNNYGEFIHTVIRGWHNDEYGRVFHAITKTFMESINKSLASNSEIDSKKPNEVAIRIFFRHIFLDQDDTEKQKSIWLSIILKSVAMAYRAKLFLILFSPCIDNVIRWTDMTEHVIANYDEAYAYFRGLGLNILRLYHFNNNWDDDAIISFLAEITRSPYDWLPENICALLYFCGLPVTLLYFEDFLTKRHFAELGTLLTCLTLVMHKCNDHNSFANRVITGIYHRIKEKRDKTEFWSAIAHSFRSAIVCSHDLIDEDDTPETLVNVVHCFTELFKFCSNYWNFDANEE